MIVRKHEPPESETGSYYTQHRKQHEHQHIYICFLCFQGFLGGTVVKNLPASAEDAGDMGLIPGLEKSPGGGNGNPLQYSCLDNPMGTGACGDRKSTRLNSSH